MPSRPLHETQLTAKLGVDVGGTFTDLALWDAERRRLTVFKLPSVPRDPSEGILAGIRTIAERDRIAPSSLGFVAHGTTVATNALLEKRGARTALITTRGFRDLLEIARQKRPDLYDLQADKPAPLVPRDRRLEVKERLLPDGTILHKLTPDEAAGVLDRLASTDPAVEAIAVCFLYSFLDPGARAARGGAGPRALSRLLCLALLRRLAGIPRVRAALDHGAQRLSRTAHQPLRPTLRRRGPASRRADRSVHQPVQRWRHLRRRRRAASRCARCSRGRPPA